MPECNIGCSAFGNEWKNWSDTSGIMPKPMLIAMMYAQVYVITLAWNPAALHLTLPLDQLTPQALGGELLYFSVVTLSTVGYGDIVLPRIWRVIGPVESVMGVLMCGMSVSALFAIAHRLVENEAPAAVATFRHQPLEAVKVKEIG